MISTISDEEKKHGFVKSWEVSKAVFGLHPL